MTRALLASAGAYGLALLLGAALARRWPGTAVDGATIGLLAAPLLTTVVAIASFAVERVGIVAIATLAAAALGALAFA